MSIIQADFARMAVALPDADTAMNGDAQRGSYVVANHPQRAARIAQQIIGCLYDCQYSEREIVAVEIALGEALSNAIRHGNGSNPAKKLRISFVVTGEKVWLRIQDQGTGFIVGQIPDPTLPENLERPCPGRGILLMRHFMTRVQFRAPGNCVVMMLQRGTAGDDLSA